MRFRKKPVIVEAWRVGELCHSASRSWDSLPVAVRDANDSGVLQFGDRCIFVRTTEGTMRAELADWLIRGTRGELYPCKPAPFEDTYEPANHEDR